MEWRDIAMALLGVVTAVIGLLYHDIKEALLRKVDKEQHGEHSRRLDAHDSSIGQLYSKLHDSDMDRMKMHGDILELLNKNHSTLLEMWNKRQ